MRGYFLSGHGQSLSKTVQRGATDVEPWADRALCNVEDYHAAGARGYHLKVAIPRPMIGSSASFARFTHPLSRDRIDELADDFHRNTHIVLVEPDNRVPLGQVWFP
jgi:hypothetical protein